MSHSGKPYVIVVGIDYSETAELALDKALELAAERPGAEVHVVHVLATNLPALSPELAVINAGVTLPTLEEAAERLESYVAGKVLAFGAAYSGPARTAPRVVPHLRVDVPTSEIAELAIDLEADLVIVGTHGRRGLARLTMGSVAEATVRLSPCPVLVMRPKASPSIPAIEPPCARCVEARNASEGREYWCEQHRERHGQRHTYHQGDRASADTNMPLVFRP
ncbi:MAG TPA: universal stress protein [Polyangiaceae bacterium]